LLHHVPVPLREPDVERDVPAFLEAQLLESCLEPEDRRVVGRPALVEDPDAVWSMLLFRLGGRREEHERRRQGKPAAEESGAAAAQRWFLRELDPFMARRRGSPRA